jgi:molybdenum cofactor cytidylyltransferase
MSVAIIILAAGASSRLGKSKQLIQYKGENLLSRICKAALQSKAETCLVVLGANASAHREVILYTNLSITENQNWAKGMGNSIKHGLAYLLQSEKPDALIISVCDQPFLESTLFDELIAMHQLHQDKIIVSRYNKTLGVPVLFPKNYFDTLSKIPDDAGAKEVVHGNRDSVIAIPFEAGAIDIDYPEDLEQLTQGQS